jgi:hypothetical protein
MATKNKKQQVNKVVNKPVEVVNEVVTGDKVVLHPELFNILTHEQLLKALFFFWDGFERSTMNFFLVKDTARQVMADTQLSGDRLTLGIRKNEWVGGQDRIFKAFMEHERIPHAIIEHGFKFNYMGVPVYLYIYDDNPCLDALDIVFYENDTFNIPNPFKEFCDTYDL